MPLSMFYSVMSMYNYLAIRILNFESAHNILLVWNAAHTGCIYIYVDPTLRPLNKSINV